MSDLKHLEYCIKLGNTQVQDKLIQMQQYGYVEPEYNPQPKEDESLGFKQRLQRWK